VVADDNDVIAVDLTESPGPAIKKEVPLSPYGKVRAPYK